MWVGRYAGLKKPEIFIDLAGKIKTEKFIMICPYKKEDFERWKKLKAEAEKISNLIFMEKIPFNKIQDYFYAAKLFVNTSDFEGFPNTFLQAAQAKTPIISLNVNPDNFISEYNCGIFCENNFEKMFQNTKELLQNKEELKIKGENIFNYLKQNHDIKVINKHLEKIIIDLL